MRFSSKNVLITGGAKGMGIGIARVFAQEGASVAIADIDGEAAKQTAAAVAAETKMKVWPMAVDLAVPGAATRMVEETIKHFGTLEILVNNAATITMEDFTTFTEADYDRIQAVNLKAPFFASQVL